MRIGFNITTHSEALFSRLTIGELLINSILY